MFVRSLRLVVASIAIAASAMFAAGQAPPPAEKKLDPQDLQKQVDDAIRQIERLDKIVPDDVRENMQRRVILVKPARPIGSGYTIGMQLQSPLPLIVEHLQLPENQGLVIREVNPDTLAAKSGLQRWDILMEFNGKPVPSNVADFNTGIKDVKQGDDITFGIIRRGKKMAIKSFKMPDVAAVPPVVANPAVQPPAVKIIVAPKIAPRVVPPAKPN